MGWVKSHECLSPLRRVDQRNIMWVKEYDPDIMQEKKEEIWLSPLTKTPTSTEKNQKSNVTTQKRH